jgi:nitrite reductase/ring-hydroxylating ferredoxin subunit
VTIRRSENISSALAIEICASATLRENNKVLVRLNDAQVIIARVSGRLFCLDALCPHMNYNLAHGAHDHQHVYCPGHGVAFSLEDGDSGCSHLRLGVHQVFETGGSIYVQGGGKRGTRAPSTAPDRAILSQEPTDGP